MLKTRSMRMRKLTKIEEHSPWWTRNTARMIKRLSALVAHQPKEDNEKTPIPVPRRLLIVKVHGMGDAVLIRALLERIQRKHPEVTIGVLVGPATRELMTSGLNVRIHIYDQKHLTPCSLLSTWRSIRSEHYDAVANFEQGSVAGTAFLAFLGIRTRLGFSRPNDSAKRLFVTHGIEFKPSRSMWDSFCEIGLRLYPDLPKGAPRIDLFGSLTGEKWVNDWWLREVGPARRTAVAMHIGCGRDMEFKQWPLDRFLDLANHLRARWPNIVIVLTGTNVEQSLISEFLRRFRGPAVDASNLGSVESTALILNRCELLISNDTGVAHLAAAIGTPTVALFGPTFPVHWAPLGQRATYVRTTILPCSPCVTNYLDLMPSECTYPVKGQCMRDIEVSNVISAIDRVRDNTALIEARASG